MFRTLACCVAFSLGSIVHAEDRPTPVRVTTADGKPAAGAKVWLRTYAVIGPKAVAPKPSVCDDAGKTIVNWSKGAILYPDVFVRDSSGRVGSAGLNRAQSGIDEGSILDIVLLDTTTKSGRVTDPRGKPIAGAVVVATGYSAEEKSPRRESGPAAWISLPEWEIATSGVKTDAEGRFQLTVPKAGYTVLFRVTAEGFGESNWTAPPGDELNVPLPETGALTIEVAGVEPAVLKKRTWRLNPAETKPAPGVRPVLWRAGTFDGTAKITLPSVTPGRYELQAYNDGRSPAIFEKGTPVEVVAGKGATVTAKFGPAAKVSWKITDPDGKALAGVGVSMTITGGSSSIAHISGETDTEGRYTGYGPGGWYSPNVGATDGFAVPLPPKPDRRLVEPVRVDAGNTHAFQDFALLKAVTFAGRIVLADAKPAANAEIEVAVMDRPRFFDKSKTDQDGRFAVPNFPPDESVSPRIRLGKAVNVPETIILARIVPPLTIKISEANAAALRGRVLDAKGAPLAGAKVALLQRYKFVG